MTSPSIETTPIPGMVVVHMPRHTDARGWFTETWHRAKMDIAGMPYFRPVQNNVAYNVSRGTTRGFHAEPWDKLVTVASGSAFGAWIDLREGDSFGTVHRMEIAPGVSVFVPRGVANAFQTLSDETVYTYLTSEHWGPGGGYAAVSLNDPEARVPWPVALAEAVISDKDKSNPLLAEVKPLAADRMLIVGVDGQLDQALANQFPGADVVTREQLDLADAEQVRAWTWADYRVVVNAAAYTDVDLAETPEGRVAAWIGNVQATSNLCDAARANDLTVVHYSTAYVFDGSTAPHTENDPVSPLGVFGQTKASADFLVSGLDRHYILRPGWLLGDGENFVRTMHTLATDGTCPDVVDDQVGRLMFAADLSAATHHLISSGAAFGTYNCSNAGKETSWFDLARRVFELAGRDPGDVTPTSTAAYDAGRTRAPRPGHSVLDLAKLEGTGFVPRDADEALVAYVRELSAGQG